MTTELLYLRRNEAAKLLGLSPKTLANLATKGDGPPISYLGARSPRYLNTALLEWANARTVANTTEGEARGFTVRSSPARA